MTDPDRDPVTVAREVVRQHGHLDRDALSRREKERLDLAHVVLSLTAELDDSYKEITRLREQVTRVRALADELDREASEHMDRPVYSRSGTRIRTALNGDNTWSTRPTTAHGTTGSPGGPCGPTGTAGDGSCR